MRVSKKLLNQLDTAWVYDLKVFPNIFTATFVNLYAQEFRVFEISSRDNDLVDLVAFLKSAEVRWLIGYNNLFFGDKILYFLIGKLESLLKSDVKTLTFGIFALAQTIIRGSKQAEQLYVKPLVLWESVDLFESLGLKRRMISLKQLAFAFRWKTLMDLPYDFDKPVPEDGFDKVRYCNRNDVKITRELFNRSKNDVKLREFLNDKFGLLTYNFDETRIGKTVWLSYYNRFAKRKVSEFDKELRTYHKRINLREVMLPIEFTHPVLKEVCEAFRNSVAGYSKKGKLVNAETGKKLDIKFKINDLSITCGLGGIHANQKNEIWLADEDHDLEDADATSYYPKILERFGFHPAHLEKEAFQQTIGHGTSDRLYWKGRIENTTGEEKVIAELNAYSLKIAINAIFGLLNSKHWILFDSKCFVAVTVNGQLLLLKLIEMLFEAGIQVISCNTDGVTSRPRKDQQQAFREVLARWQNWCGLKLETESYSKMVFKDINNYIWFGKKLKFKGSLTPVEKLEIYKNHSQSIVRKAVSDWIQFGTDAKTTIETCVNPLDFAICQRIGSDQDGVPFELYKCAKDGTRLERCQKTTRYYNSLEGLALTKFGSKSSIRLNAKYVQSTFDNFEEDKPFQEYGINLAAYIEAAEKIINPLKQPKNGNNTSKLSGVGATKE